MARLSGGSAPKQRGLAIADDGCAAAQMRFWRHVDMPPFGPLVFPNQLGDGQTGHGYSVLGLPSAGLASAGAAASAAG
jgi:hypothetical protein